MSYVIFSPFFPPFFFLKQLDVSINGSFRDFNRGQNDVNISFSMRTVYLYRTFFIIGGIRMSRQDRVRLQFSGGFLFPVKTVIIQFTWM